VQEVIAASIWSDFWRTANLAATIDAGISVPEFSYTDTVLYVFVK
jgi:hypothetical protein